MRPRTETFGPASRRSHPGLPQQVRACGRSAAGFSLPHGPSKLRSPQAVILFLKNLLFTAFVAGFVAGWMPFRLFDRFARPPEVWAWPQWLGGLLLLSGVLMFLLCVWLFGSYGRGTPAPIDAPKKLVQRGPYRWVRNPMYLAVLTIITGEAVFFQSWHIGIYLLCLACAFQIFVMLYEEPALSFSFGAMYEDYRRDVPRWLPRPPSPRP